MKRRDLVQAAAAAAGLAALGAPLVSRAQPTKLKVGFLHTLDCDVHLWLGERIGAYQQQGLQLEKIEFVTGLEAYQALAGGSVDLVTTGAVISNFPARGQGKAFLLNGLETGIAQVYVSPDSGIKTVADLKGKKIATTRGTTAHFFLHRALLKAGLDSTKDIEIVHQRMDQAVTSFVAGSVPAVALWLPLDAPIHQKTKGSVLLAKSGDYPDATVVSGWSARNGLIESQPETIQRFIKGWATANDHIVTKTDDTLKFLASDKYKQFTVEELRQQHAVVKWNTAVNWLPHYSDGSIQRWLNQVTDFNVEVGAFKDPIRAEKYFDPNPYRKAIG